MADSKNALASAFNAIDDREERIANLTILVQALSPWERRHVRIQLGDNNGLAGFEDLPAEIVCNIVPCLKIEDVLAVTAVSTHCRAIWTEPSVATRLCQQFFPALRPSPSSTFPDFFEAAKRYFARRAGKCYTRVSMSIPFTSNDTPSGYLTQSPLEWEIDSRKVLRPDPALHLDDAYPAGWLDMIRAKFGCYGGGNVVWFAIPDYFVVDNMYTLKRRVVRMPHEITEEWIASSSKALVVLNDRFTTKLLVYDIETNTSLDFELPSFSVSMVIRDRRIFLVLARSEVCVLDYDGSRISMTYHFEPTVGPEGEDLDVTSDLITALIFPHPNDLDCFFVALKLDEEHEGLSEDSSGNEYPWYISIPDFFILEYKEGLPVAIYGNPWEPFTDKYFNIGIELSDETEALDDQGSFATGHWSVKGTNQEALEAFGLPPLPKRCTQYKFQSSFNTITREFYIQRHAVPKNILSQRSGPPWSEQCFFPHVPMPDVLKVRRVDADYTEFCPTRSSRPGTRGERNNFPGDWAIKSKLIDKKLVHEACRTYHDGDFTVMFLEDLNLVYVWRYLSNKEAAEAARSSPEPEERAEPLELS